MLSLIFRIICDFFFFRLYFTFILFSISLLPFSFLFYALNKRRIMATSPLAVNGIAAILKPLRLRSCGVKGGLRLRREGATNKIEKNKLLFCLLRLVIIGTLFIYLLLILSFSRSSLCQPDPSISEGHVRAGRVDALFYILR
jgi:hypothetical protein